MTPTEHTGHLLQHVASLFARQYDAALQERLGIGYSQFKVLLALRGRTGTRQRVIANSLGQTEASISRQVKFMQHKGFLHVTINPRNRREHTVELSAKGQRVIDEALLVLNYSHAPLLACLSSRQQSQLAAALARIHYEANCCT